MRVITRKRIYRAFPELDHLSDFQCRQLMRRINLSVWRLLIVLAAALVVLICSCFVSSIVLEIVGMLVDDLVDPLWDDRTFGWVPMVAIGATITVSVFIPLLLALLARDYMLGVYLKRGMRVYLRHTTCPGCRYQLIGQQVDARGCLRCPECGRQTTLTELGLDDPADLLPPRTEETVD